MSENDELIERVVDALKEPVRLDPALDRRVMAEVAAAAPPRATVGAARLSLAWLRRTRTVRVSPLGGLALAAGIAALVLIARTWIGVGEPPPVSPLTPPTDVPMVQFVLVAPGAVTVSLVGDFNDWSVEATPMLASAGHGVWAVTIPLAPGRYRYAFLVDGSRWLRDPAAPPALDNEFGPPNSVLTVGGS